MRWLESKTNNQRLISYLEVADSFITRGKGLLGHASLGEDSGMWIHRCNSVHTFFMKFSIDCIFVDKNLKVKKIYKNVKPWRLVSPVWGANSVFELAEGTANRMNIRVGDQLYVGS